MALNNRTSIAHCIASMDKNAGGTTTSVLDILIEQSNEFDVELYTLNSSNQIDMSTTRFKLFSEKRSFLGFSFDIKELLKHSNADIFHGHALWNLPIHQMVKAAKKKNKPYIVSIHGMLHPWSLRQSSFKKKSAMLLYQHKDLVDAACLHATSHYEAQYIKTQGYRNPIAVIPNGLSLKKIPLKNYHQTKDQRRILFLSRIHSQKGIELLLDAWCKISEKKRKNWILEIVGMGDENYVDFLKAKCLELYIDSSVVFCDAVYGKVKIEKFHSADFFVLPSYTENFGMVIAEALSSGVPVITTKGTPWKDLEEFNAGSWIDLGTEVLKETLEIYMQKDSSELAQMGRNGRKLVEEKYSIESVGEKFKQLYLWLLNRAEKPTYVL